MDSALTLISTPKITENDDDDDDINKVLLCSNYYILWLSTLLFPLFCRSWLSHRETLDLAQFSAKCFDPFFHIVLMLFVVAVVVDIHYKRLRDIHDFLECFSKFGIEDGVDNRIYKTISLIGKNTKESRIKYWNAEELRENKQSVANIINILSCVCLCLCRVRVFI